MLDRPLFVSGDVHVRLWFVRFNIHGSVHLTGRLQVIQVAGYAVERKR